ncbi:MAG: PDZ domain-containing protein [Casimicrobium sp.]
MPNYSISFADPSGHLLHVQMTIDAPVAEQRVALPSWIPGSYLMREYARNVVSLSASQGGTAITAEKTDKSTWQLACVAGSPVTISYTVYAWDRSVRGCYFDASRGFVNPAASLLMDCTAPNAPCALEVIAPQFLGGGTWRCATSMTPQTVDPRGFGRYVAVSYDELIDHPLECADFDEFSFDAGGVTHRFVITGKHRGDLARLRADSQKICQGHCDLFGGAPPFPMYLFQLHVVDDGYGGLEHRASTALISPRSDLPVAGDASVSEGYRDLLGLISHEYFYAWNVKRIKPAAFMTHPQAPDAYDTSSESYTRLLWLFEGFTSYFDDLMLRRVGLITDADYLKLIGRRLTMLLRSPGRSVQSSAEASFDAWIKYYRADENAANSQFSYYLRGSFVALALDLQQRAASEAAPTVDDVMRALWREFGAVNVGVPEDVCALFSRWLGRDLTDFFARFINGTEDPDWAALFAPFGITYNTRPSANAADRGGRDEASIETNTRTLGLIVGESAGLNVIKTVLSGSAAWRAGLSAGDTLVAIDGLRASSTALSKHLARFKAGDEIAVTYFRHDVLASSVLLVPPAVADTVWLTLAADDAAGTTRRARWLGQSG